MIVACQWYKSLPTGPALHEDGGSVWRSLSSYGGGGHVSLRREKTQNPWMQRKRKTSRDCEPHLLDALQSHGVFSWCGLLCCGREACATLPRRIFSAAESCLVAPVRRRDQRMRCHDWAGTSKKEVSAETWRSACEFQELKSLHLRIPFFFFFNMDAQNCERCIAPIT